MPQRTTTRTMIPLLLFLVLTASQPTAQTKTSPEYKASNSGKERKTTVFEEFPSSLGVTFASIETFVRKNRPGALRRRHLGSFEPLWSDLLLLGDGRFIPPALCRGFRRLVFGRSLPRPLWRTRRRGRLRVRCGSGCKCTHGLQTLCIRGSRNRPRDGSVPPLQPGSPVPVHRAVPQRSGHWFRRQFFTAVPLLKPVHSPATLRFLPAFLAS